MAAAAILNLEKLMPFSNSRTNFHQIWWQCFDIFKTTHDWYRETLITGIQHGGCRHLEFRRTDAVLSFLYQDQPSLVEIMRLWRATQLWCRKTPDNRTLRRQPPSSWILKKTDTSHSVFDQLRSNLVRMLRLWPSTYLWYRKTPGNRNPKWRLSPCWTSKRMPYSHFWPAITKFSKHVATLINSPFITSQTPCNRKSTWRLPPSWISKNWCCSTISWPISTKFGQQHIYDIEKRLQTGIQDGGCRNLEFR